MTKLTGEQLATAIAAAEQIDADVYLYNGEIGQTRDFMLINTVAEHRSRPNALLIMTTHGGDPDCAYRMCRYFQERYEQFTVLIAGRCKSAGTLLAIGASELAFMPYGELGPLDIQMSKVDKFDRAESGLTIQDALNTLEERARETFYTMVQEYMAANNGMLSFPTASKAAGEFVAQLYGPVFGRIDPEEIGVKTRSMRIAQDYSLRLNIKWENVRPTAVEKLATSYSSHSFVIDRREAETLFTRVRDATEGEVALVGALGGFARFQVPRDDAVIVALSTKLPAKGDDHANDDEDGGKAENGPSPEGAGEAPAPDVADEGAVELVAAE